MNEEIKKFIENYRVESPHEFSIDSYENYSDKKIEIVLSTNSHMASISILSDFTYDFLALEIDTENVVQIETKYFRSSSEIINKLNADLEVYLQLKKF